jgi:hypothetical protein
MNRRDGDDQDDRRAVRVRDDALMLGDRVRIHLGHDERHVRLHAECGGVVDHHGARLDRSGRHLPRDAGAGGEKREVDAAERVLVEHADFDVSPTEADFFPSGALRSQRNKIGQWEAPRFEDIHHLLAHGSGGSDDCDAKPSHGVSPSCAGRARP